MPIAKFTNKKDEEVKQNIENLEYINDSFLGTKDEIIRTFKKMDEVGKEIAVFRKQMIEEKYEIKREIRNFKANKFASSGKYLLLKESKDFLLNLIFLSLLMLLSKVDSIQEIPRITLILFTVFILIIVRIVLNIISFKKIFEIEDEEE